MKISNRLVQIIDIIPKCEILSDIGTDHAFVPIEVIKKKKAKKAIASDVRSGPLNIAKKNITKNNLLQYIEIRQGSGIRTIGDEELDTVVIAGMGGILIKDILEECLSKAKKFNHLILQPMNSSECVREYLYENGFQILNEVLLKEDRRIYNIMVIRFTGRLIEVEEEYKYVSKAIIENKDQLASNYIDKIVKRNENRIEGLKKSKCKFVDIDKLLKLNEKLRRMKCLLN